MKTLQTIKLMIPAVLTLILASCGGGGSNTNADSKIEDVVKEKAGMKTFMIEYKTSVNSAEMKSTSMMTQWIDNENDRQAIYTDSQSEIMGMKNSEKSLMIIKEGWSYIINLNDKTGFKSKDTEMEDDPTDLIKPEDDITFRQMIEQDGGKILASETFLGKDCIVVEVAEQGDEGQTMKTKMWYYKGIPLKMANDFYIMEATKFEENVSIPDSKFEIPAGIEITEMPSMP
jgi:outer membrane lipoprotein-sorting protein